MVAIETAPTWQRLVDTVFPQVQEEAAGMGGGRGGQQVWEGEEAAMYNRGVDSGEVQRSAAQGQSHVGPGNPDTLPRTDDSAPSAPPNSCDTVSQVVRLQNREVHLAAMVRQLLTLAPGADE